MQATRQCTGVETSLLCTSSDVCKVFVAFFILMIVLLQTCLTGREISLFTRVSLPSGIVSFVRKHDLHLTTMLPYTLSFVRKALDVLFEFVVCFEGRVARFGLWNYYTVRAPFIMLIVFLEVDAVFLARQE